MTCLVTIAFNRNLFNGKKYNKLKPIEFIHIPHIPSSIIRWLSGVVKWPTTGRFPVRLPSKNGLVCSMDTAQDILSTERTHESENKEVRMFIITVWRRGKKVTSINAYEVHSIVLSSVTLQLVRIYVGSWWKYLHLLNIPFNLWCFSL